MTRAKTNTMTPVEIEACRYIPKNAVAIREEGLGAVYVYPSRGKYGVIAFHPKAIKCAFHYLLKSDKDLDAHVIRFFDNMRDHQKRVADYRAQRSAGHSFKVGDIVTNSWGYDQTNVDWYRVTKTTKNFVWLKPVAAAMDNDESGFGPLAGPVGLALDENLHPIEGKGPETKHHAQGDSVTMRHGCGSKYTGGSLYTSWGH